MAMHRQMKNSLQIQRKLSEAVNKLNRVTSSQIYANDIETYLKKFNNTEFMMQLSVIVMDGK